MSANLRAVIAASRATTPRLRPRPVSRFEASGPSLPEFEADSAETREQPVSVVPANAAADTAPGAPLAVPAAAPRADAPPAQTRAVPPSVDSRPIVQAASQPKALIERHHPIAAPAPPEAAPRPPRPERLRPAPLPQPTDDVPPQARWTAEVSVVRDGPRTRSTPNAAPRIGALVPPQRPTDLPTPSPPLPRSPRRRTDPLVPATSATPSPDIHVSIGRIEVRATPAATPPRTDDEKPARSTVVGLDDYLAQRGSR